MTDSHPSEVTAYLEDVKRRWEVFGESDAMPRLLAAVGKVLELADEWKAAAVQLGEMAERASARGADYSRTAQLDASAQSHQDSAQAVHEAITRALLSEGDQ